MANSVYIMQQLHLVKSNC